MVNLAQKKVQELKKAIQVYRDKKGKFSVSLDEWTSCANKRYININLHCPELNVINLGLIRIHGSATAEACKSYLERKLLIFGISLEDIVAIVTDGAAVMLKFGRITGKKHQLCMAHGIHLAVMKTMYCDAPSLSENESEDCSAEESEDSSEIDSDDEELSSQLFETSEPVDTPELVCSIDRIVKKVREVSKLFRNSPVRNEVLQEYIRGTHNGKELSLILDTKTRWNSLVDMVERFLGVHDEIKQALCDLRQPAVFSTSEILSLQQLVSVLKPVKLAVEALCRRDANLITADVVVKFMMQKIEPVNTDLSRELYKNLNTRIRERRNSLSEVLNYLHTAKRTSSSPHDFVQVISRASLVSTIQSLISPVTTGKAPSNTNMSQVLLFENSMSIEVEPTIEVELDNLIQAATTHTTRRVTEVSDESLLKKEMALFETGGSRGKMLEQAYQMLKSIPPTSVEAERAFSCANQFCSKLRSKLSDDTLNYLVFLKSYFKSN